MIKRYFQVPSRIPQLYFGSSAKRRELAGREKLAEALYAFLALASYVLFLIGGLFGYLYDRWFGALAFAVFGYVMGMWARRSLGMRGRKATTGFFRRMGERARGARPGLLEWLLEAISGAAFTQEKCRAVVQVHEKAVKGLKGAKSPEAQNRILVDLDRRVQEILYP